MKKARAVVLLFFVILAAFVMIGKHQALPPKSIILDVYPKMTFSQLTQQLEQKEIISFAKPLYILGRLFSYADKMKAGEYELHSQMSYRQILQVVSSGSGVLRAIVIPEGFNMYQIAEVVEKQLNITSEDFLTQCKEGEFIQKLLGVQRYSLEGYLFPDTYNFAKYTAVKEVISVMVNRFFQVYKKVEKEEYSADDLHRLVILASVIEKESGVERERGLISSVFHNRIQQRMKLQSDPTIIYGVLDRDGVLLKNIKKKHILERTPFNTYVVRGMPKGPIANPGYGALYAAKYPQETEYLFFVSKNNGEHVFSKTYDQHVNYVNKYQKKKKK